MQINLISAERIRLLWPVLTAEEKADLEAEGTIKRVIRTFVNLQVEEDEYGGKFDVQARYKHVATGEVVGEDAFLTDQPPVDVVHDTLGAGLSLWPRAVELLVIANGGTMPTILPPKVVEPAIEPEPEPEPEA